jgi:hypothetical protein
MSYNKKNEGKKMSGLVLLMFYGSILFVKLLFLWWLVDCFWTALES